jgi:protein SCO1/2
VSSSPEQRAPLAARLVSKPFVWAALMGVLFGVPIYRSMTRRLTTSPAVLGGLPAFTLTDQRGQPFGSRELQGKVWVADFIFTSCQGVCPLLSERMAEIGKRARHLGPDFHLVSISVDPERDTPARLAEYGARYGANPIAWSFLTGPEQAIQATVVEGFKIGAGKEQKAGSPGAPADGGAQFWEIFHGENLVLVDRQLRIRGYFPATAEGLDKLMEAVGRVVN